VEDELGDNLLIFASRPILAVFAQEGERCARKEFQDEPCFKVGLGNYLAVSYQATLQVDGRIETYDDVDEEQNVEEDVVVNKDPVFGVLEKGDLEGNEERDDDLVHQDNRRVDRVHKTKRREQAGGGHLRLYTSLHVCLLVLQDRFKLLVA